MQLDSTPESLTHILRQLNDKMEQESVLPRILEEVQQIKTQQAEILTLLRQQNQMFAAGAIPTASNPHTMTSRCTCSSPSTPSKQRNITIYVYNTITTPKFIHFVKYLQSKMDEIYPKKCSWLRCHSSVEVKHLKSLDSIPQNAALVLLCCFSAASRVDASQIAPQYVYLRNQGYLVVCVCFRPDGTFSPAKIFVNSAMEEVPTYSVHVNKKGIMDTSLTNESLKSIEALLGHTD